jgi:hypothetical protein
VDSVLYDWYWSVPDMLLADASLSINTGDSMGRRKITHNDVEILTRRGEAGGNSGTDLLIDPNSGDTRVVVNAGTYENWDMITTPFSNAQMAYNESTDYIRITLRREAKVVIAVVGNTSLPAWMDANGWVVGDTNLTYSFNGGGNQAMTTRINTLAAGVHTFKGFNSGTTSIDHWTMFVAETDSTPTDPTSAIPTDYASAVPDPNSVIRADSIWHNLHWGQGDDGLWYKSFHDQQDQKLGYFYAHDHGSRYQWFEDSVTIVPTPPPGEYPVSLDPLWNYTASRDPEEGLETLRGFKNLTFYDPDASLNGQMLFHWPTGDATRIPPPHNPDGRQWMTFDYWLSDSGTGELLAALHMKLPCAYFRWNYPTYNNASVTGPPNQQVINADVGTNMGINNPPVATNGTGYWSFQMPLLFASLVPWHSSNDSGITLVQDNPVGRFQVRAADAVTSGDAAASYSKGDVVAKLERDTVDGATQHYDMAEYYVQDALIDSTVGNGAGAIEMIHYPFGTAGPAYDDADGNPDDQQGTARWFIVPNMEPFGIDTTGTQRAGTESGFFYTDYTCRFLLDRNDPMAVRQYVKPNTIKGVSGSSGRYLAEDGYDAVYSHKQGGSEDIRVWRNRGNKISNALGVN